MSRALNGSKSFTRNGGSCLISMNGDVKIVSSIKDWVGLLMRKASMYGATLSDDKDDMLVAEEVYVKSETDDCESSKLVCVVGVDNDDEDEDEGESLLKKWGIRFKSRVRSPPISLTKEVIKSLRSTTKVGGEEGEDIKAIAEVDGPGESAIIVRLRGGIELISREYKRVCVSEGVISTGWGYTLKKALALFAQQPGREASEGLLSLGKGEIRSFDICDSMSRTQYRRGPTRQSTSFPTWPQPVP